MRYLLALAAALLLTAAAQAQSARADVTPYQRAAAFDGVQTSSRYLPSYDGTRLAVTIHRPSRAGQVATERLPVIVTQARSDARPPTLSAIRYFVERGYIWVAHDRRGTGASFGVQTGFVNQADARDGAAVIAWAGAQAFSNGKVAAFGCSNQGAWQYLVLRLRPKHLVAISPQCASAQFFDHGIALNGIPMLPIAPQPYAGECARPASGARPARDQEAAGASAQPPAPGPTPVDEDTDGALLRAAVAGQRCGAGLMGQYWLNMPRDGYNAYAKYRPALEDTAMTDSAAAKASGVAVLQVGGWYDAAVAGQFESQRVWGGKTIMGPWVHGNRPSPEVTFPGDTLDVNAEVLRWFDFHLKGIRNGANRTEIVYYTVGAASGTEWRRAPNWTAASGTKRMLYLTGDTLSYARPSPGGTPASYPQQDVRLFDGQYTPLRRLWTGDMARTDAQSLVHTGTPLPADTEVTGTPSARLWVSADAADANVFAILEDVAPGGRSTYVTDGRLRASWRALAPPPRGKSPQLWHRGFAGDIRPLTPDRPTELAFDFFPVSYVFPKGHRVRVSIVTSLGDKAQAPPLADGKAVTLTLHRDAARPSAIVLPIVGRP